MRRIAAIFLCALLIRMALIAAWYQWGSGDRISWDGGGYYVLAKNLLAGKGFQWEGIATAKRPPLYPVFIAGLLPWSPFPLGVYIAQALVGALSCVALFGLGQVLFGRRAGLAASLLMAFDYVSIRQTVSVMTETVFVFFLIVSFYCLIRSEKERKNRWLIGAGLLSGAACLTRDVFIFFYPCIVLWILLWKETGRIRLYRAAAFLIPFLLVIGPWILRNSLLFKRPVLITTGVPALFYLANNPTTTGGTTGGDWEVGLDTLPPEDVKWPTAYTDQPEWERYILKQALDFIRNNPGQFVGLMGRKIVNMWRPYQSDSPLTARWATALTYLPVLVLGLGGMLWKIKCWRKFFPIFTLILYTFSVHAILIAHMRYRYPVMPFFMVFAAFTLVKLWECTRVGTPLRKNEYV